MRLTGSRAYIRPMPVPKMPPGIVELMEDLTRDVLKNNPADVYEFCAGHMHKLLEIRDGPSFKPPLTLEQKIARAQEKVRKRGEARWQKYLKEKENKTNRSKVLTEEKKTDIEEITAKPPSPVVQPVLKPPVYPDFNIENASEIEISHEPGSVSEATELNKNIEVIRKEDVTVSKEVVANIELKDKEAIAENKELAANIEKVMNIPASNSSEIKHTNADNSTDDENKYTNADNSVEAFPNAKVNEVENEVISVPKNENIVELEAIKTEVKDYQNILESKTDDKNKEEHMQYEIKVKTDDLSNQPKYIDLEIKNEIVHKLYDNQENVPDVKNNLNKSEQKTEVNSTLSNLGTLVNTAVSVCNIFNENARTPSRNAETTEDENNDENKSNSLKNKNPLRLDIVKADSSTESFSLKDIEPNTDKSITTEYIEKKNEKFVENYNSETYGIKSIEDDTDNISNAIELYSASQNVSDAQNIQEDKSIPENDKEQANVNDILPIIDVLDKSENKEVSKSDNITQHLTEEEESNKNGFEPPIIHINDVKNDNEDNFDSQVISAMDKLNNVLVEPEDLKEVHDNNPSEVTKSSDTLIATNSPQILHGEEPSVNVLDIYETENVQEPNENNIIEIRISQVAEALNNEVPLPTGNNSVKILEEPELPLNPPTDNQVINAQVLNVDNAKISKTSELPSGNSTLDEVNAQLLSVVKIGLDDKYTEKENEVKLFPNAVESDETPSISTFVDNTDDLHNLETANAIKSLSIDESTDGMDNNSLIESGKSEATDDVIQQNPNNNSMDLETAAVTIQKVFRSFLFKSRASTFDDNEENISLDEDNEKKDELEFQALNANLNKERRGISRMDTVLQTVNEEKSLSLSTDDSSTLSSAATTIQAHVRGFLVRNKLHSHKTASTNSLVNSDGPSASLEDTENKNKTILNIHIVPEGGNYLSRDESMLTSMDLSLDGSPPSSLNLHPLGYDKNERRKQLKREDAIQSISPPSNNSGKLSEDVDSVKDMIITEGELQNDHKDFKDDEAKKDNTYRPGSGDTSPTTSLTIETVIEAHKLVDQESTDADSETPVKNVKCILTKQSSDEMDVVTPFEDKSSLADSRSTSKLMHSGEFHDIVLPTKVSRSDAAVVSEFKNVLVYFLLWNNS